MPLHCRNVARTAVPPQPPACAAADLPRLSINGGEVAPPSATLAVGAATSPGRTAAVVALAAALPLAALLIAAFAGKVVWRRQRHLWQRLEREALPNADQCAPLVGRSAAGGSWADLQRREGPEISLVRLTRRGRLAALLAAEVGPGRGGVLPGRPAGVAHQLGSTGHKHRQAAAPNSDADSGLPALREEEEDDVELATDPSQDRQTLLSAHQAAVAAAAEGTHSSPSSAGGTGNLTTMPVGLQWGLPTESLRMPASELEVGGWVGWWWG